jgi:hypothetical protein
MPGKPKIHNLMDQLRVNAKKERASAKPPAQRVDTTALLQAYTVVSQYKRMSKQALVSQLLQREQGVTADELKPLGLSTKHVTRCAKQNKLRLIVIVDDGVKRFHAKPRQHEAAECGAHKRLKPKC